MQQISFARVFGALLMAASLSASSAVAQRPGRWTGTNSFGYPMNFIVSLDGLISDYRTGAFLVTCPSGAQDLFSLGGFGAPIAIVEGSFSSDSTIRDGDLALSVFSGTFVTETEASGNFHVLSPRFRVQEKAVDSQICTSDFTWTATWQSFGAVDDSATPLNRNVTCTSTQLP